MYESKQISTNKRSVAIVGNIDVELPFTIFKMADYSTRPYFITITNRPLNHEILSTYILMPREVKCSIDRVIRYNDPSELPALCSQLDSGNYEEKVVNASLHNVGEHHFTKKPPDEKTSNYDDSYNFWVTNNDGHIRKDALKGVAYEYLLTGVLSSFIAPGDTIVDAGTNIGTVSLLLSRLHNSSVSIISFECFPKTYALLFKNIVENKTFNVTPIKMALGDKYRPVVHLSDSVLVPAAHTAPPGTKGKIVKIALDAPELNYGAIQLGVGGPSSIMSALDDFKLNISAMKVDVEGAEPLVFYGARETIKRCMPVIVFEKNENVVTQDMIQSLSLPPVVHKFNILEYCYSLGYRDLYSIHIADYMLVPPNRNYVSNSITKFAKVKKMKDFKVNETKRFNLFRLQKAW